MVRSTSSQARAWRPAVGYRLGRTLSPMNHKTGAVYETLVHELVASFCQATPLNSYLIGHGAKNRILGASGYKHQIDLSLVGTSKIFIIEMKCLKRSIGVKEILVLAARLIDIQRLASERTVVASIISKFSPSRNVKPLAQQFGIQVDVVENPQSFAVTFLSQHFVGIHEKATASTYMDAEIIRKK